MKLSEYEYVRPDMGKLKIEFNNLLGEFRNAKDFKIQNEIIGRITALRNEFDNMLTLASVRYSQDTTNQSYQEEQNFFDESEPLYRGYVTEFYRALSASAFRHELIKTWGKQLFSIAEMSVKTFSDDIIADLILENRLISEYTKLLSSARILFDGLERNLSEIDKFLNSKDRKVRKEAHEARYDFFRVNSDSFDKIFNELVHVRNNMAKKLGYENYVGFAYNKMLRGDYNASMVEEYRNTILTHIVPVATKLRAKQKARLGLDELYYYDEPLEFNSGNPSPKGTPDWITSNASLMYNELSPETGTFFNYMKDNEMLDLEARKGKAPGGYCTVFPKYKSPFIFSNFNGTAHDITVLTHEAGHAFQVYSSREAIVPEYFFPTYEACEIHSMSMEFITWPWMNLFFKEDTEKFKFSHVNKAVLFLPYGVAVDEFQHRIYEQPDLSAKERKALWKNIEEKYIPSRKYIDNNFLEEGGYWQQQRHIYNSPFYYIDYTLAQVCAFQFWERSEKNKEIALKDYIRLCEAGGSKSFLELVELAGLTSPFKEGCVSGVSEKIMDFIEAADERKF